MKTRYIVGGIIVLVFFVWAIISFNKSRIDYKDIDSAKAKDIVGLKTDQPVEEKDEVFKVG